MVKLSLTLTLAALLGLAPMVASAATPRVNHRQTHQKTRIAHGVNSGELTKRETVHLVKGQAHVRRVERRVKADGSVTVKERARLERKQDRQSRRIYLQKHDAQQR